MIQETSKSVLNSRHEQKRNVTTKPTYSIHDSESNVTVNNAK